MEAVVLRTLFKLGKEQAADALLIVCHCISCFRSDFCTASVFTYGGGCEPVHALVIARNGDVNLDGNFSFYCRALDFFFKGRVQVPENTGSDEKSVYGLAPDFEAVAYIPSESHNIAVPCDK